MPPAPWRLDWPVRFCLQIGLMDRAIELATVAAQGFAGRGAGLDPGRVGVA